MASYAAFLAAVAFFFVLLYLSRRRKCSLPPGPRGIPIVGNLFDTPKAFEWLVYQDWTRQYGAGLILH